ncbi:DSBA-like thioredoxin domain protein [Talaromyces proteolyticus]|uniref:DSBA-like thioredoxin domain protein n=1 Tax=Talaromyces proteolyticus TaxID=1131652 RepID=A0AAD4KZ67_9EURO|nr:DSBA-like thioredoxin domain protein [Talaromyces proteolyticus]KAH8704231.1 DSBA-like thioredoxin domain protein [Talaromyces proteolyticus]
MTNYKIDIVSDTICPWCYIGHRRLSKAIAQHTQAYPTDTFSISWHAFYLNPDGAAYPGINKMAMYEARLGGPERAKAMAARLTATGAAEGIAFSYGGNTGRTRDSHRLVYLAGQKYGAEKQTQVVEALFRAYFEEEKNITDKAVLLHAATESEARLPRDEVQAWLDSDLGGKEVDQEAYGATSKFVTGVPNFTIQGKYVVEGAEDPAQFLEVFQTVKRYD